MRNLKDIVKRAPEGPALMFRARPYDLDNPDDFLADISALANADIVGQRALIIGVSPGKPDTRKVQPLARDLLPDASTVWALLEKFIEPALSVQVLTPGKSDKTLLVILLDGCDNPPYLLKRSCGVLLKGAGFIRREDQNFPLGREESERLRSRRNQASDGGSKPAAEVVENTFLRLTFPDGKRRCSLTPVADDDLPSALATRKLQGAIQARKEVQAMKGLDTGIVRLMHVRAFGQDQPFAKKSIEELEDDLRAVHATFAVEDDYHVFEKTSHRINFVLQNDGERPVRGLALRMRIQRVSGFVVVPCIYTTEIDKESRHRVLIDTESPDYPVVQEHENYFDIIRTVGDIERHASVTVFPEPLRVVVRSFASNGTILISYYLESDDLQMPIKGTLELRLKVAEEP